MTDIEFLKNMHAIIRVLNSGLNAETRCQNACNLICDICDNFLEDPMEQAVTDNRPTLLIEGGNA